MNRRPHVQRRRETHDGNETRSVTFDGDKSNASEPTANRFFPLVVSNDIILRPEGELRRQRNFDGEIVLQVSRGGIRYSDSSNSSDVIRAGVFARIPARRGNWCVLKNASSMEARIFEIGVASPQRALESGYEQRRFTTAQRRSSLCVVASSDSRSGALQLAEDVVVYSSILLVGQHVVHETSPKRRTWLHVVEGELAVGDLVVSTGNGAEVTGVLAVSITAREDAEFLLIDIEDVGS